MNEESKAEFAEMLAAALDALGEPFPNVAACIQAGQSVDALIDSMRAAIVDAVTI